MNIFIYFLCFATNILNVLYILNIVKKISFDAHKYNSISYFF